MVTPRAVDAPAEISGSGASGDVRFRVTPGLSGTFTATATGLMTGPPRGEDLPVAVGQQTSFGFQVAAGTKAARITVQTKSPEAAVEVLVIRLLTPTTYVVVAESAASANHSVVLSQPVAGTYGAYVTGVRNAPGTTSTSYVLRAGLVRAGTAGEGGFTVQPSTAEVRAGRPIELTARWSGLPADVPYVGWIEYPNGSGTVVSVN